MSLTGPTFDSSVTPGGYVWWYVDGISDDGRFGVTAIAFIGSVFSPYYAARRQSSEQPDPLDHCAINVALYGPRGTRWAMTERRRKDVRQEADCLAIGPSRICREHGGVVLEVHETAAPLPRRVVGQIKVTPEVKTGQAFALDSDAHHQWWPMSPRARIEVDFKAPEVSWSGDGYLDSNEGCEPLEDAFSSWTWARTVPNVRNTNPRIYYDVRERNGETHALSLSFKEDGTITTPPPPPQKPLPHGLWRVPRTARGTSPRIAASFEDTPFYTRSLLHDPGDPEAPFAVHESLSLERFSQRWVQWLLPFRMPRM